MSRRRTFLLLCFALLVVARVSYARVSEKSLSPRFRQWLTEDTAYIIQSDEKSEFLALKTDAERDAFIQQFWNSRNPVPGSEVNTFKEEHYRRLAYANEHFGDPRTNTGWRTDEGMVYITLGEPQQKVTYPNSRNVRPMIAWFYQQPSPALPPFFYVLFYKRSAGDPYTLYSPYQDGPNRLVTGLESLNDQKRSLKQLRQSMGDEVARLAISLIPTEPVNLEDYSPSMVSDSMLATIKDLPDNYLEKQRVAMNRGREKVTASILSTSGEPDVAYSVSHDASGKSVVNYLLSFPDPDPTLIGTRHDKSLGYDLTLRSRILTESGKQAYEQVDVISGVTTISQGEVGKKKPFAAEQRLPLEPGRYVIESTLTNNLNLQGHRVTKTVVVPPTRSTALGMSEPVVFTGSPSEDASGTLPFSLSKLRFNPRAIHSVTIHSGDRVPFVFQLWLPKDAAGLVKKVPVQMHYLYGSSALNQKPIEESDETIETTNADSDGNLVSGHTFQTIDLPVGTYRVVVRAAQEGSAPAYATLLIRVVPPEVAVGDWTAYGPTQPTEDAAKRLLSLEAQGKTTSAKPEAASSK